MHGRQPAHALGPAGRLARHDPASLPSVSRARPRAPQGCAPARPAYTLKRREAFNSVVGVLEGYITMELAADGATDGSEWVETFNAGLDALDPAQFPLVTRHLPQMYNRSFLMRWKSGNAAPLEDGYNFLIEPLILGLEAQAKRARNRD